MTALSEKLFERNFHIFLRRIYILTLSVPSNSIVSMRRIPNQFNEFAKVWGKVHKNQTKNDILKIQEAAYYEMKNE